MTPISQKFDRHLLGQADEGPREGDLPDQEPLTPDGTQARQLVAHTLIEPAGRRACAVFLGRDDYTKLQETVGFLMAHLYMECLPRFVRELGGEVVLTGQFAREGVVNAVHETLTVDGRPRTYVFVGYIFLCLPGERVVISAEPPNHAPEPSMNLTVRSNKDSAAFLEKWKAYARRHNYLHGRSFFADGEIIERTRRYRWDDILLPDDLKRSVQTHVAGFLRHREELRRLGVKARRGLILEGPPGTGKTLLGKVLADTLDCSFIWVSPRHIDAPGAFEEILNVARFVSPSVVFLEDLDLFAEDRNARSWIGLGELMNQLDGALDNEDIITIATTNRLEVIEGALRNRPGRFDRILTLDTMDESCRRRMLERLLAKASVLPEDLAHLVDATDGYTGAQVEELVNTLYILAVEGHDGASGNGDGGPGAVALDRPLIEAAMKEFQVELKARVGFHAG